jgi:hypothetical protein
MWLTKLPLSKIKYGIKQAEHNFFPQYLIKHFKNAINRQESSNKEEKEFIWKGKNMKKGI